MNELAKALAAAQGEMTHPKLNKTNPHFRSQYADLASCLDVCRKPLAKHGLAVVQRVMPWHEGYIVIQTKIIHESGQSIADFLPMKIGKAGPQEIGSLITYGRRYGLCAMLGLFGDADDDGNAAQGEKPKKKTTKKKATSKPNADLGKKLDELRDTLAEINEDWQDRTRDDAWAAVVKRASEKNASPTAEFVNQLILEARDACASKG